MPLGINPIVHLRWAGVSGVDRLALGCSVAAATACNVFCLDNHLSDALATESLGADKVLALDGGEGVADGRQEQEDGSGDQGAATAEDAQELEDGHDAIGGGAQPVGGDLADEAIELFRGRTDAQQQRHLDEEDDKGGGAGGRSGC